MQMPNNKLKGTNIGEESVKQTKTFLPFTSIFVNRPLTAFIPEGGKSLQSFFYNNDNTLPMGSIKTYQNVMAMSI